MTAHPDRIPRQPPAPITPRLTAAPRASRGRSRRAAAGGDGLPMSVGDAAARWQETTGLSLHQAAPASGRGPADQPIHADPATLRLTAAPRASRSEGCAGRRRARWACDVRRQRAGPLVGTKRLSPHTPRPRLRTCRSPKARATAFRTAARRAPARSRGGRDSGGALAALTVGAVAPTR
jgi:hypothetical protein